MDIKSRLLRKVRVNPKTGCWEWTATKNSKGYGMFWAKGKFKLAHRVSYEIHREEIPDGLCVLHHCDRPGCLNPDHLFIGTQADNMADMYAKRRHARGSAHSNAKLTEDEVIAIRALNGVSHHSLAKNFGVGRSQIQRIVAGQQWKEL